MDYTGIIAMGLSVLFAGASAYLGVKYLSAKGKVNQFGKVINLIVGAIQDENITEDELNGIVSAVKELVAKPKAE